MFKIPRLEQALLLVDNSARNFEVIWWSLYDKKVIATAPFGLAVNYREFPNYLLSLKTAINNLNFQVSERFLLPDLADQYFGAITGIHIDLANWMAKSRRVYVLSSDLAARLALTPVDDITWNDIKFPFDAFAISLEQPITTISGKIFDFIIVAKIMVDGQECLVFDLLSPELANLRRRSQEENKLISRLVKRKEYAKALEKINSYQEQEISRMNNTELNTRVLILTELLGNQSIHASLAALFNISKASMMEKRVVPRRSANPEDYPEWDQAANIICGLCLYLAQHSKKLTYSDIAGSTKAIHSGKYDNSAVTSVEDVCSVAYKGVFNPDEHEIIIQASGRTFEMSAHFRRGHWRKVDDGSGNTKIIWIHPTLVRADRLSEGSLPGGLLQKVE